MKTFVLTALITLAPLGASAQMQPSDATAAQIVQVTNTFTTHLRNEDYASEYAMLTDSLRQKITEQDWKAQREAVFALAGPAVQVQPHALTYYTDVTLLAAVDYAAQATTPDIYICGYMLWQFIDEDTVQLSRFEQNVVDAATMKQMDINQAAQLMTDWHCPASLIEGMLSVRLNN